MNLILFGFKGSGKTHFGKLLARKMERPFIDTDEGIKDLYTQVGPQQFRALERAAIVKLQHVENSIIALGGGAVLDPQNVELLQTIGALVYLKTGPETLKKRIFQGKLPAFFDPKDPEKSFWKMIQEREPIYRSIPARCVDTDALDEAGVIAALTSILLLEDPPNGF